MIAFNLADYHHSLSLLEQFSGLEMQPHGYQIKRRHSLPLVLSFSQFRQHRADWSWNCLADKPIDCIRFSEYSSGSLYFSASLICLWWHLLAFGTVYWWECATFVCLFIFGSFSLIFLLWKNFARIRGIRKSRIGGMRRTIHDEIYLRLSRSNWAAVPSSPLWCCLPGLWSPSSFTNPHQSRHNTSKHHREWLDWHEKPNRSMHSVLSFYLLSPFWRGLSSGFGLHWSSFHYFTLFACNIRKIPSG